MAALMLFFAGVDAVAMGAATPERVAAQGAAKVALKKAATRAVEKGVSLVVKFGEETLELDAKLVLELSETGCFAPGTLVATETGQRPIETIQQGERVWAIPQAILTKYPGLFTVSEIHSLANLRGIPNAINSKVHLSQIATEWNAFYRQFPNATRSQIIDQAAKLDAKYSAVFIR
jgi:hypothetical protein